MNLLRDENGYVLVLGRPHLAVMGAAEKKVEEIRPHVHASATAAQPSCALPHCCFYCVWCGEPILLPHDRMGSPFGNPNARKIDVRSIASVCSNCKHIGTYTMFHGCRGFDTRHKIVVALSSGTTSLLTWLKCTEKTCSARVPFFAKFDLDSADQGTDGTEWLWDELTCAYGHRIKPVPLDLTIDLPVRSC